MALVGSSRLEGPPWVRLPSHWMTSAAWTSRLLSKKIVGGIEPWRSGCSAPHLGRRLHDQAELRHFLLIGDRVALDRRGEPALRREAQLLDCHVLRSLFDPPLELIL